MIVEPEPETRTLELFVDAYRQALTKLAARGVQTANGRLLLYRRVLEAALACEQRDPEAAHPHQERPEFFNALLEANEMISIARLDDAYIADHHVRTKYRSLGRGTELMDPTKDDPARNYAFEFATAALAAENNNLLGFRAGDVEVGPPACPIECKRVSSLVRLGDNLATARDQLVASGRAGIIAIDLTTPIRHQQGLVVHSENESAQRHRVDQELAAYLDHHWRNHIERAIHPAVLGVVFRHVVVGSVGAPNQIGTARTWQLCCVHDDNDSLNDQFLASLGWMGSAPIVSGTRSEIDAASRMIFGSGDAAVS